MDKIKIFEEALTKIKTERENLAYKDGIWTWEDSDRDVHLLETQLLYEKLLEREKEKRKMK